MNLIDKQKLFPTLLAKFIISLENEGYEVTLGEVWRSPETAREMAAQGKGIANSLHCLRLAVDLNLFKQGLFLTSTSSYAQAGKIWKAYSTKEYECCWGGDFSKPDGDHFSIECNAVR